MQDLSDTDGEVKIDHPIDRQVITPTGKSRDTVGHCVREIECQRHKTDPTCAAPGCAESQGNDREIKEDEYKVVPLKRTIPANPVQIHGRKQAVKALYQRER